MGSNTLTYDGRGNLATFNGWTYTYDAHNLLIQATDTMSDAVTQAYDPLGRCVKRTVNAVTNYYVYDLGWRNLADFNGAGTQINRYVCGPATNEIATKTDSSGNVIYYHTDGLGSITKLTNSAGALVEQYIYNVFGQVTMKNAAGTVISASAYANRFLFAGAAFVPMLGLYDLRCRFYSPVLGRFLQPDPIGHRGDTYNVYRYCGNNCTNYLDPDGEFAIGAIVGLLAGGVSGVYGAIGQGGNWQQILVGGLSGAAVGFAFGFCDPTEGFASVKEDVLAGMALGAASGAVGDVAGQVAASCFEDNGTPYQTDWNSVEANALGGAIGGGVGGFYTDALYQAGADEFTSGIVQSALGFPFSSVLPAISNDLGTFADALDAADTSNNDDDWDDDWDDDSDYGAGSSSLIEDSDSSNIYSFSDVYSYSYSNSYSSEDWYSSSTDPDNAGSIGGQTITQGYYSNQDHCGWSHVTPGPRNSH